MPKTFRSVPVRQFRPFFALGLSHIVSTSGATFAEPVACATFGDFWRLLPAQEGSNSSNRVENARKSSCSRPKRLGDGPAWATDDLN